MSTLTFFDLAKFYFFITMLPFVPAAVWYNTQRSILLTIISTYLTLCFGMDYFLLQFLRIVVKLTYKMARKNDSKSKEKLKMDRIIECKCMISHLKESNGPTIFKNQEMVNCIVLAYQMAFTSQKEELYDFYMFKALISLSRNENLKATIFSTIALALIQEFKDEKWKNQLIMAIRENASTSIQYTKWIHTTIF